MFPHLLSNVFLNVEKCFFHALREYNFRDISHIQKAKTITHPTILPKSKSKIVFLSSSFSLKYITNHFFCFGDNRNHKAFFVHSVWLYLDIIVFISVMVKAAMTIVIDFPKYDLLIFATIFFQKQFETIIFVFSEISCDNVFCCPYPIGL